MKKKFYIEIRSIADPYQVAYIADKDKGLRLWPTNEHAHRWLVQQKNADKLKEDSCYTIQETNII